MTKKEQTRLSEDGQLIYALSERVRRLETKLGEYGLAARAVIAAGRPQHYVTDETLRCVCHQCAAWDALKALLEGKT